MSLDISGQYDKIYRYCYFKVNDRCLAEDLTQETFLRYFSQGSYVSRGKQLAYLYTIARNLCIDYYRSAGRAERMGAAVQEGYYAGAAYGVADKCPQNPMEHVEKTLSLQMAVDKLPPEQQELILLRYVNELSVREICKITGLSRSSEYRMEKAALRKLKKILQEGDLG